MGKDINIVAEWQENTGLFKPKFRDLTRRLMSGRMKDGQALVLITVKPYRRKRTIEQNAFYWGAVMPIILDFHYETTGEEATAEQMHHYICTHVMGIQPEIVQIFGKTFLKPSRTRTSKMSVGEFARFIETVRVFFQEKGCDFRDLDERDKWAEWTEVE